MRAAPPTGTGPEAAPPGLAGERRRCNGRSGPPASGGPGHPAACGVGPAGPAGPPPAGAGAQPPPGGPRGPQLRAPRRPPALCLPAAPGPGRTGHVRPVEKVPPAVRPSLQRPVRGAPLRRRRGEDRPQREQVHLAQPVLRPAGPGRRDPQEQRRRSRLGALARQRKVLERNRRIARMHRDGRSNRAIARDIGLSPPQVGQDRAGRAAESWGIS